MPPSPLLSARMTKTQYLMEIMMISAQKISESKPSMVSSVNFPMTWLIACTVYSGLVPRSP